MSTEAVLNHHLQAFSAGDADEAIKDYTEDSILITPDATLKGLSSIHAAFRDLFSGLFKSGTYDFTMDRTEVVGEIAYIVWHSVNQDADVTLGTDTYVIQDGKIVVQTYTARIEEKE